MAKYGFTAGKVEFDNSGGTLVDLSQYVTGDVQIEIEAPLEDITPVGATAESWVPIGLKRGGTVTLSGVYDDTATTGPDAILNAVGNTTTRTLKITWGGTKTTSIETIIQKYTRKASKGKMTAFEAVLQTTGAVTET